MRGYPDPGVHSLLSGTACDWPAEKPYRCRWSARRSRLERRVPPRLPLSLNAGPRRTRSRVRGADPLSPGSAETSRGRSRAGTGTRPPARVRGRRNCLGRPRDPQHARDRASTRGRLPASNLHRTFPVFEDHHDRGALSPRACDHSRGRGQRAKPASPTSGPVESGRESRTVGSPRYLTQVESWVLSRRPSPSRRTSGGAATAVLAVGLLKTGGYHRRRWR